MALSRIEHVDLPDGRVGRDRRQGTGDACGEQRDRLRRHGCPERHVDPGAVAGERPQRREGCLPIGPIGQIGQIGRNVLAHRPCRAPDIVVLDRFVCGKGIGDQLRPGDGGQVRIDRNARPVRAVIGPSRASDLGGTGEARLRHRQRGEQQAGRTRAGAPCLVHGGRYVGRKHEALALPARSGTNARRQYVEQ
ncbi:MAG: hypothetical protein H0W24_01115 [Lysobacter sp.]|nr:hypothetical protein [Lysobacter sp.]